MVLLLHSGRCYEAEICTILFPLRCAIVWYDYLTKSKFSDSGQKPCTIIRRFDQIPLLPPSLPPLTVHLQRHLPPTLHNGAAGDRVADSNDAEIV